MAYTAAISDTGIRFGIGGVFGNLSIIGIEREDDTHARVWFEHLGQEDMIGQPPQKETSLVIRGSAIEEPGAWRNWPRSQVAPFGLL